MSEAARAALLSRRDPLAMVIFDCDGVLIDSEPIADRVVAAAMAELGAPMSTEEAHIRFLGMRLLDMPPVIEELIGRSLPEGWVADIAERLVAAMAVEATLMPGAMDALEAVDALGFAWRIASNSGPRQLAAKFAATRLTDIVVGRVLSAADMSALGRQGKPAPDIYLAAAEQAGVAPAHCLVIEDSPLGVRGAVAAGMLCFGLDPEGAGAHLQVEGAVPFRSMGDLPALLKLARRSGL